MRKSLFGLPLVGLSHFGFRQLVVTAFMRSGRARGRCLPTPGPDESGQYPSETVKMDDAAAKH